VFSKFNFDYFFVCYESVTLIDFLISNKRLVRLENLWHSMALNGIIWQLETLSGSYMTCTGNHWQG